MPADAERAWWELFGFLNLAGLDVEVAAAERAAGQGDDNALRRLAVLAPVRFRLRRGEQADEED